MKKFSWIPREREKYIDNVINSEMCGKGLNEESEEKEKWGMEIVVLSLAFS